MPIEQRATLPFAVFDEFGHGADDRVREYAAALVYAEQLAAADAMALVLSHEDRIQRMTALLDAERDFWRVEGDKWRAAFETAVTALAKAKPTMYRHAPTAEYSDFCDALDEARIFLGA